MSVSPDSQPAIARSPSPLPSQFRFVVLGWLASAAAIAYLCRNSLTVMEKPIREELGLTMDQMGFLLGPAFFWPYALVQAPAGWLATRLGSRICIPIYALAWSTASAAFGWAEGFAILITARIAAGIAQGGLFPCCMKVIADWHPATERGTASGVLGAAMSVGGAIGAGLTGWLLMHWLDWRGVSIAYALPGLAWAIGFWLIFRDDPLRHPAVGLEERRRIAEGRGLTSKPGADGDADDSGAAWALAMSPALWLICGQQFFRASGYAFFASWFATYLQETRGVSASLSGTLTMMPLIATVLASLSGGGVSDWVYRRTGSLTHARKTVAVASLTICGFLVCGAFFVGNAAMAVIVMSFGVFCAGFAGPCAYSATIDMGGRHAALVFGAMNMIGNLGAGLLPWLVPPFKRWVESRPDLLAISGGNGWNAVLLLFAILYWGGAICWLGLKMQGTALDQSLLKRDRRRDALTKKAADDDLC